ncbi:MAG: hypothetical protein ACREOK_10890, partial [Gemmatimonadaceae bacterium]
PALAAIWPVLFLAGNNPGEFVFADLVVVTFLAALSGLACAAIVAAMTHRVAVAALGGVVLVAAMYAPALLNPLRQTNWLGMYAYGPTVPLLILLMALLLLSRLRAAGERVRPALVPVTLALGTLVLLATAQAARSLRRAMPAMASTPAPVAAAPDSLPDIYLIVLDEYAAARVTSQLIAFDNREFQDSLRTLGFRIPTATWSNYSFTAASIASMLDMRHIDDVAGRAGRDRSLVPLNNIIARNAAFTLARSHGYRIVFVPSSGFEGTRSHPAAERTLGPDTPLEWLAEHATSPLAVEMAKLSVIGSALKAARVRLGSPWREMGPFRRLREAVTEPGPKFVFAHAMMTHQPYQFTADCDWATLNSSVFGLAGYRAQIECTNRQLLDIVEDILASARPSVILLQGDHGSSVLGGLILDDPRTASAAQVAERLDAFSAYRLADGSALPDTITPVNLLRLVFNRYLGTALPLQSNNAYFSVLGRTYDFVPVDMRALADSAKLVRTDAGSGVLARR